MSVVRFVLWWIFATLPHFIDSPTGFVGKWLLYSYNPANYWPVEGKAIKNHIQTTSKPVLVVNKAIDHSPYMPIWFCNPIMIPYAPAKCPSSDSRQQLAMTIKNKQFAKLADQNLWMCLHCCLSMINLDIYSDYGSKEPQATQQPTQSLSSQVDPCLVLMSNH